jgi:site-specific DNA-methyltransferase (adenine-specific)
VIAEGIHLMDCAKGMRKIQKESVDLIFTDPPYVKDQWEKAYTDLGRGAARILKPSGYLITYCGHYYLPGVLDTIRSFYPLEYYWTVAQMNTGAKSLMHHRNILAGWKPILIFQKKPINPTNKIFMDVIKGRMSKDHHPWEQSIHEALHLISRFGAPGDLVVDPFLGSGTSLLAAKLLGMRLIGFEINEDTFRTAQERMEQQPLDLSSFKVEKVEA